jgi:hypothetical protein
MRGATRLRRDGLLAPSQIWVIFEGANELQQRIVARRLIGRDVTG